MANYGKLMYHGKIQMWIDMTLPNLPPPCGRLKQHRRVEKSSCTILIYLVLIEDVVHKYLKSGNLLVKLWCDVYSAVFDLPQLCKLSWILYMHERMSLQQADVSAKSCGTAGTSFPNLCCFANQQVDMIGFGFDMCWYLHSSPNLMDGFWIPAGLFGTCWGRAVARKSEVLWNNITHASPHGDATWQGSSPWWCWPKPAQGNTRQDKCLTNAGSTSCLSLSLGGFNIDADSFLQNPPELVTKSWIWNDMDMCLGISTTTASPSPTVQFPVTILDLSDASAAEGVLITILWRFMSRPGSRYDLRISDGYSNCSSQGTRWLCIALKPLETVTKFGWLNESFPFRSSWVPPFWTPSYGGFRKLGPQKWDRLILGEYLFSFFVKNSPHAICSFFQV